MALPRLLADAARDFPDVVAVEDEAVAITWLGLATTVEAVANGLSALEPRRVVLAGSGGMTEVIVAHVAWRLGVPLMPLDAAGLATWRRDDGDVLVASRKRLEATDQPAARTIVDDLTGLPELLPRGGGRRRFFRRGRRPDDRMTFQELATASNRTTPAPSTLATVTPDTVALELPGESNHPILASENDKTDPHVVHRFSHRELLVAAFQLRLWLPDMSAGSERLAMAMPPSAPGGLAAGVLLATLVAGTMQVTTSPRRSLTIPGASVAFAPSGVWQEVATTRSRHLRTTLDRLRIGGIMLTGAGDTLAPETVCGLVDLTKGARFRHFWQPWQAAGPVVAQPIYGRIVGQPGAVPLPDTVVATGQSGLPGQPGRRGRRGAAARGPQVAGGLAAGWTDVSWLPPIEPGNLTTTVSLAPSSLRNAS